MTAPGARSQSVDAQWMRSAYADLTDRITGIPLERGFRKGWLFAFGLSLCVAMLGLVSIAWLVLQGVGVWGINIPVGWGFAIINFVWWIGIGHAGTLISAILLLVRQDWRNSINRFAEAMTLFAVANAALFPLLHLGRIWKFYYILPYPNRLGVWPQWRSPLVWDVFAIATYGTVSLLFWYIGLVPDLASLRDRARRKWVRLLSGFFALGWSGSARHWHHYQSLYLLLAGLATPLVVSVHSIVSLDFAVAVIPGWHSTVFPPFFVAGAIYSGFAMVLMIAIPLRRIFGFKDLITVRHLDNMGKVMLVSGLIVAYGYIMETFTGWYSGEIAEWYVIQNRAKGPYAFEYWGMILCNIGIGQLLWFRAVRRNAILLFFVALLVNTGMWLERFVIVVTSLHRDFMPSSWGMYIPSFWDWSLFAGTLGIFACMMLLFIRYIPMISVFEMRELVHHKVIGRDDLGATTSAGARYAPEQSAFGSAGRGPEGRLYGVMGEFHDPEAVTEASVQARAEGYTRVEAYGPFPVARLAEALGSGVSPIWAFVLAGAVCGGVGAYLMQWYTAVVEYPLNVGGRPLHSWPSFVPLTFELAVLGGALLGVVGLLRLNRLPRPYHPVFNAAGFDRASQDTFFLCLEAEDPRFDRERTWAFLKEQGAARVSEVTG